MMKFTVLPLFMKENFPDLFGGVCTEYQDQMDKVHYTNLKDFTKEVQKFQIEPYTRYDTLYSDNISNVRTKLSKTPSGFSHENHSIFFIGDREKVLVGGEVGQESESAEVELEKLRSAGRMIFFEEGFRLMN